MDHALIVEQLLARCTCFMENSLPAADLHRVATASRVIFAPMRQVAREILQAQSNHEAQQLKGAAVVPWCQEAAARDVHPRTVSPQTLLGQVCLPVRTFQGGGCGAALRPDDQHLGVPEAGAFTDDVRALYAPVVAELPPRVANDLFARYTGVTLSSCGAQGLIDRPAQDLKRWPAEQDTQEGTAVAEAVGAGDRLADLRVESARDGVTAQIDGRWPPPKVATIRVRRLAAQAEEPTRGAVLARRYVCGLGAAAELATRIQPGIRAAGGERIPLGASLGDGAPWSWNVADAHVPGGRQPLAY